LSCNVSGVVFCALQDVYSFLPAPGGGTLNLGGTAQIYGLTEAASRDCDVTCQLMSVETTRSDDEVAEAEENLYANTTPVRLAHYLVLPEP